jgi:hypothetical protein
MLFRGYETGPDGAGYVQEWRAQVLVVRQSDEIRAQRNYDA